MVRNLLVIAPEFFSFVKDQTIAVTKYVPNTTVLVRHNPIAEISTILPIHSLITFRKTNLINRTALPPNISLIPNPVWYLPIDIFYKQLGHLHHRAANQIIQKNNLQFDLVHAHATWSSGYVGARIKEEYNVPLVVTAHGYDIYSLPFKDAEWKKKIEYVLNTADAIITVSNKNLECIRRLDVGPPVYVIPNGFRSDLFYPRDMAACRRMLGLPIDRKILLTVGNLEPVKGHIHLIEAIKIVVRIEPDLLCIIVGDGSERSAFEKQIQSLNLENNVHLVGRKVHDEVPLWINACDIFVLPSLNEGNPTVMFETFGCGKPFIGTRVGGVPDAISSEDIGLLAKPADAVELAEKIVMALGKGWDQEKILAYAQQFTWEKIVKELVGIYDALSQFWPDNCPK